MKKLLCIVLAAVMVLSMAACSNNETTTSAPAESTKAPETTPAETTKAPETTPEETTTAPEPVVKELTFATSVECTTMNPLNYNSSDSTVYELVHGGLYHHTFENDEKIYIPCYADGEPVKADADGKVWTVKIKDGVCFSDGTPITAETFYYSYKMVLDPKLANVVASYVDPRIVNSQAYFKGEEVNGKAVAWEDVGIKLKDGALEFTFTTPYTQTLDVIKGISRYNFSPVDPDLYASLMSADGTACQYGTSVETTKFSGAYACTNWVKGSVNELVKNENFPLADDVKIDTMKVLTVPEAMTRVEMFSNNEIGYTGIDPNVAVQFVDSPDFFTKDTRYIMNIDINDNSSFYEVVNQETGEVKEVFNDKTKLAQPILSNMNFKNALWYAIDRVTLAKLEAGVPANFVIPLTSYTGADSPVRFRESDTALAYTEDINDSFNPEKAKEYFETALKEEGLDKIELSLIISSDNAEMSICAQFLQEQFNEIFEGKFTLKIDEMPSSNRLSQIKSWRDNLNAFELALTNWNIEGGDTNPADAMNVYSSSFRANCNAPYHVKEVEEGMWAKNLNPLWGTEEFDVELAGTMEKAFLENRGVIPMFERTSPILVKEWLIPNSEDTACWQMWRFDIDTSKLS